MADTRCANPEYQLDVDVMIVEYIVYKAVEAQLKLFRSLTTAESVLADGADDLATSHTQEAVCLIELHDSKCHHAGECPTVD